MPVVVAQRVHSDRRRATRRPMERAIVRMPGVYRLVVRWGLVTSPRVRLRQGVVRGQVLSGWAAAARRDFELMTARYARDIVYESTPALVTLGMPSRADGTDAWLDAISDFYAVWSRWDFELCFILDLGDRVVNLGRFAGRGAGSGIEVQTDFAQVIDIRRGLVARERDFNDWSEALEAAGIDRSSVRRLNAMPPGEAIEL